jgi:hypothetical protein
LGIPVFLSIDPLPRFLAVAMPKLTARPFPVILAHSDCPYANRQHARNVPTQLSMNLAHPVFFQCLREKKRRRIMRKSIVALAIVGIAASLTGCAVAPGYGYPDYGDGEPYGSPYGYPYDGYGYGYDYGYGYGPAYAGAFYFGGGGSRGWYGYHHGYGGYHGGYHGGHGYGHGGTWSSSGSHGGGHGGGGGGHR